MKKAREKRDYSINSYRLKRTTYSANQDLALLIKYILTNIDKIERLS